MAQGGRDVNISLNTLEVTGLKKLQIPISRQILEETMNINRIQPGVSAMSRKQQQIEYFKAIDELQSKSNSAEPKEQLVEKPMSKSKMEQPKSKVHRTVLQKSPSRPVPNKTQNKFNESITTQELVFPANKSLYGTSNHGLIEVIMKDENEQHLPFQNKFGGRFDQTLKNQTSLKTMNMTEETEQAGERHSVYMTV